MFRFREHQLGMGDGDGTAFLQVIIFLVTRLIVLFSLFLHLSVCLSLVPCNGVQLQGCEFRRVIGSEPITAPCPAHSGAAALSFP